MPQISSEFRQLLDFFSIITFDSAKKYTIANIFKLFFVSYLFYFFFLFILHIQARFDFLSWQDGVYAVFAGLAVTVAFLVVGFVVYRLCVRIVKYIGRKW